ncbi:MAG TPA: hypothetical protein VFS26_07450, partial [Solirubrobacterales bacterium]|nr:hypothetical protein [Solirubrobacterales bacterium]
MRLVVLVAIAAALAVAAGCGDSPERTAPGPAGPNRLEREVRSAWERTPSCSRPAGASRWGCSVRSYRCQSVVTGRGWSVSCARP